MYSFIKFLIISEILFLDTNMESDHFMSAEEAVTFGLVDKVEQPSSN